MSYEVWSQEQLQKFAEDNWARVPDDKRKACVEHLREILPQDLTDYESSPSLIYILGSTSVRAWHS
jgi:hypothetical protein